MSKWKALFAKVLKGLGVSASAIASLAISLPCTDAELNVEGSPLFADGGSTKLVRIAPPEGQLGAERARGASSRRALGIHERLRQDPESNCVSALIPCTTLSEENTVSATSLLDVHSGTELVSNE